jgi:hypothetical protein
MGKLILLAIVGCICLLSPAFAAECGEGYKYYEDCFQPRLTDAEICNQLDSDQTETEIKLRQAIIRTKVAPHDFAAKFNRDLYEMQDSVLQNMLRRYCGWR